MNERKLKGELLWEVECKHNSRDTRPLENGNRPLPADAAGVVATTSAKQVALQYGAWPKSGFAGRDRIRACLRLLDRLTLVPKKRRAADFRGLGHGENR